LVLSCTVTENELEALLPAASVAEQVTEVTPISKSPPDAGVHVIWTSPSTMSVAVASDHDTGVPALAAASTTLLAGRDIAGAVERVSVSAVASTVASRLLAMSSAIAMLAPDAMSAIAAAPATTPRRTEARRRNVPPHS
jgi:hypothetical protein